MTEYRKGNWTVSETMVLIEAKRMEEERRMKRVGDVGEGRNKRAELRWKWVEDYCWRKGCLRSQNQCNDKWDNLMRDYKKVREYERKISRDGEESYWKMEKGERKAKNLPSNMLAQIYEGLVEVVERRGHDNINTNPSLGYMGMEKAAHVMTSSNVQTPMLITSPLLEHQVSTPLMPAVLPLPPPLVLPQPPMPQPQPSPPSHSQPVDCDTSEDSETSGAKRRRRSRRDYNGGGSSSGEEVGNAIRKSASIIAEALEACEEREERRHREVVSLHERRLKIEESNTEISRQGINGLVDAINKLANSIMALASHKNHSPPK